MKQSVSLMILLLSLIFVASATADTRLMLVTDLHYLAPELYDTSGYFERILLQGDGKVAHESETLLNALKAEVAHQAPDALLISGDLTFNGETASHVRLAGALREIEEAGIIMGVPWLKRMTRIIIPIEKTTIVSGYLLPFISAMRELSLFVILVTANNRVLTTLLLFYDEKGYTQFSNAVNLLIIIVVLFINFAVERLTGASIEKGVGG